MMNVFNRLIDFFELRMRRCHLLCQGNGGNILAEKDKKNVSVSDTLTFWKFVERIFIVLLQELVRPVAR
jgi:hypothetical protein